MAARLLERTLSATPLKQDGGTGAYRVPNTCGYTYLDILIYVCAHKYLPSLHSQRGHALLNPQRRLYANALAIATSTLPSTGRQSGPKEAEEMGTEARVTPLKGV